MSLVNEVSYAPLTSIRIALALATFMLATVFGQPGDPEPATTFSELRLRLSSSSIVIVTDQQGRRMNGGFLGMAIGTLGPIPFV